MSDIGLYIHIPFCGSKCHYCDFNSYDGMAGLIPLYVEALRGEITRRARELHEARVVSIFVGGGTPTLLPVELLQEILLLCRSAFRCHHLPEITVEANPGTVSGNYLKRLTGSGFNRISLGAQSLHDNLLKILGRRHTVQDILSSVRHARSAGFADLSLDMIFGIPGQTAQAWEDEVRRVVELDPSHLSLYNLTLEQGTGLYRSVRAGSLSLPDEEIQVRMYETGIELLAEAGYNHYEISNFSRPGKECLHNRLYWENREYAGFGAGAWSYLNRERKGNITSPGEYIRAVREGRDTVQYRERLSGVKRIRETAVMNLRLLEGINTREFSRRFGEEPDSFFKTEISAMEEKGLLIREENRIRLSRRGILFSNTVFAEFV